MGKDSFTNDFGIEITPLMQDWAISAAKRCARKMHSDHIDYEERLSAALCALAVAFKKANNIETFKQYCYTYIIGGIKQAIRQNRRHESRLIRNLDIESITIEAQYPINELINYEILTKREKAIISLLARGYTIAEAARIIGRSHQTVYMDIVEIRRKHGMGNMGKKNSYTITINCSALTPCEQDCLAIVAQSKTRREASLILNKPKRTVDFHIHSALKKLNASHVMEAVLGLIASGEATIIKDASYSPSPSLVVGREP